MNEKYSLTDFYENLIIGDQKITLVIGSLDDAILEKMKYHNYDITQLHPSTKTSFDKNNLLNEFEQLISEYKEKKFDIVFLGNNLITIMDPQKFLEKLHSILNSNANVICIVPNFSHGLTRLDLLNGNIKHESDSIIAHQNTFTLESAVRLFKQTNYDIKQLYRKKGEIIPKNSHLGNYEFPKELLDSILSDFESSVLEYFIQFSPSKNQNSKINDYVYDFSRNQVTEKLKEEIENYTNKIDELQYLTNFLKNSIKTKDEVIKGLQNSVKEQEEMIDTSSQEKQKVIDGLQSSVKELEEMIETSSKEKQKVIDGLQDSSQEKQEMIDGLQDSVKEQQEMIETSSQEKQKVIDGLQDSSQEKQEMIETSSKEKQKVIDGLLNSVTHHQEVNGMSSKEKQKVTNDLQKLINEQLLYIDRLENQISVLHHLITSFKKNKLFKIGKRFGIFHI